MGPQTVPLIAAAALAVWTGVLVLILGDLRHDGCLPEAVREGSIVAVYAACLGGLVASLRFVDWIDGGTSALFASAWRSAVLVAGIYALIGAWRARARR